MNWQERSTGPGVMLATDFTGAEDFSRDGLYPHLYANGRSQAQFDMLKLGDDNGIPCLQIDIVANNPAGTTQGQAWRSRFRGPDVWPNDGDGVGTQPFWIQFGFKIPASRLVPWRTVDEAGRLWVDGVSTGHKVEYNSWKFAIIANMSISNPWGMSDQSSNSISHVLTNKSHRGHQFPVTYAHNNGATNGAPYEVPMPDGDINLSQGWQAPNGGLCRYSDSGNCPLWPVDKWVWFQYRQHTRTYGGTAGNELDVWWAPEGATAWQKLVERREYLVGNQPVPWRNGFNAIWLTGFETDRDVVAGVDSRMLYRHLIVSSQEIPFPAPDGAQPGETKMETTVYYYKGDTVKLVELAVGAADPMAQVASLTTANTALTASNSKLQDDIKALWATVDAMIAAAKTDQTADDANKAGSGVQAVPLPPRQ